MRVIKYISILAICSLLLSSCKQQSMDDPAMYLTYLANPSNGIVKQKTISGIKYRLKYLPGEYLAFNTIKNEVNSKINKDSLIKAYENSVTFLLNIGPDDAEDFDITRLGVSSYGEFVERIEKMAFEAQNWISIEKNGKIYHPSIVRLENINALEKNRNFVVVFSSEKNSENDLRNSDMCFVYDDELFNTGVNKFMFDHNDIKNIPQLRF